MRKKCGDEEDMMNKKINVEERMLKIKELKRLRKGRRMAIRQINERNIKGVRGMEDNKSRTIYTIPVSCVQVLFSSPSS